MMWNNIFALNVFKNAPQVDCFYSIELFMHLAYQ